MTKKQQIYKCEICGNIVEVLHEGAGTLVCCGKDMVLQEANKDNLAFDFHYPIIETKGDGSHLVKIGEKPHPMEEDHYIEWIEIQIGNKVGKKFLKPGDIPEAEFFLKGEVKKVRAYCNKHGLWEKD